MIKYKEAIKKPFTDITKLLIGIVISMVPVINWFARGFILESSGLGKTKASKKMPEWKNWSDIFFKGFVSYVIGFIYLIPAFVLFLIGLGFTVASLVMTYAGTTIPREALSSVISGGASPEIIRQLISQAWMLALPTLISLAPVFLLGAILLLIGSYLTPIAVLNYLKNNKFSKAFDMNLVTRKAFTGKYFIVWLVASVIALVINVLLNWIPIIGDATSFFIAGVIVFSLYGQVFREVK